MAKNKQLNKYALTFEGVKTIEAESREDAEIKFSKLPVINSDCPVEITGEDITEKKPKRRWVMRYPGIHYWGMLSIIHLCLMIFDKIGAISSTGLYDRVIFVFAFMVFSIGGFLKRRTVWRS